MDNLLDEKPACNTEAPRWLILHRPHPNDPQRRTWGSDMARLVDDLVKHGWVMWREGREVHVKHRAWVMQ